MDYGVQVEVPVEVDVGSDVGIEVENSDVGSDESTEPEHFTDSEYEEDDKMFNENVDSNAKWGGVREKSKELGETRACDEIGSDDEYLASDDLKSVDDSFDEEPIKKMKKWTEFNKKIDMEDPPFTLGMLFPSSKVLAEVIKKHAIKSGKQIRVVKCERKRVTGICKEGCQWMI